MAETAKTEDQGYGIARDSSERIDVLRTVPFYLIHVLPIGAFWMDVKWQDWAVCIALYWIRIWFITGAYHRYFSHRTYKTSRWFQFLLAFGGSTAAQKGVLWWSAHHRHHHKHSDGEEDIHSPRRGFWWSHVHWILCEKYEPTAYDRIKDFAKYPELVWLNKYHLIPPTILGVTCWLVGGWSMLFIGFFLSTVFTWHGTFTINSLSHVFGTRRFETTDTSRNNFLLALLTLGEGWHNNHHHYQSSSNNGFYWWEIDITYYVLKMLSWVGLVWDLRKPPQRVLDEGRNKADAALPKWGPKETDPVPAE